MPNADPSGSAAIIEFQGPGRRASPKPLPARADEPHRLAAEFSAADRLHMAFKTAPRARGGYGLLHALMAGEPIAASLASTIGKSGYNPDEPRIPAGQSGSGQWTTGGDISSETAAEPVRHALGDPVPVVLSDGSVVRNPNTGGLLLMPYGVSLEENAKFGELISQDPSSITGPPPTVYDTKTKEGEMLAEFYRYNHMDYQRIYSINGLPNKTFIDFGNYNYGVVAAAAGYSKEETLIAAGAINLTGSGDKSGPYFNNPRNASMIEAGYDDYIAGKIKTHGD